MTVFTCAREYEDMLTCIYDAWASKLGHSNIRLELEPLGQYSMFNEYVHIEADDKKATSVRDSVMTKISPFFYREIFYCLGYYSDDVLDNIYRMLLLGFKYGNSAFDMIQYEAVNRFKEIKRALGNETCHFKEFLRFHEVRKSIYVAHIEPRSRVASSLGYSFMDRMPSEYWMIVDDTHKEAVIHPKNEHFYIRRLTDDEYATLIMTEQENDVYTDLWKAFFDNIAIKERTNPRYQRNSIPIWTRKHAVEFY